MERKTLLTGYCMPHPYRTAFIHKQYFGVQCVQFEKRKRNSLAHVIIMLELDNAGDPKCVYSKH